MFAARCIGVSLAVFVLLYVFLSLLISQGWKLMRHTLRPSSARGAADLLFALRVLPLGLSVLVTVAFTLPSFLLLEPRSTGEAVGTAPLALGVCCLVLLGAGVARAALAQRRASRALVGWLAATIFCGIFFVGIQVDGAGKVHGSVLYRGRDILEPTVVERFLDIRLYLAARLTCSGERRRSRGKHSQHQH